MASWQEVVDDAPDFARAVQGRFDAHQHKVLATLRKDGSPRISGIEASFAEGELWLGMMLESRKALDLLRDPRLALHSATPDVGDDPTAWTGDAKIAGRAIDATDPSVMKKYVRAFGEPEQPFHLFTVDIAEVVLVRVGDPADHLDIDVWRAGRGLERIARA